MGWDHRKEGRTSAFSRGTPLSGTLTQHTGVRARTGLQPHGQQRRAQRTPPGTSNARRPRAARATKGSGARGPRRGREAASGSPPRPPPARPHARPGPGRSSRELGTGARPPGPGQHSPLRRYRRRRNFRRRDVGRRQRPPQQRGRRV